MVCFSMRTGLLGKVRSCSQKNPRGFIFLVLNFSLLFLVSLVMSGPTWLPPKQVGVSGSPGISVSSPALCKPQRSFATISSAPKPTHGAQEAYGAMSGMGPAPRCQPSVPGNQFRG